MKYLYYTFLYNPLLNVLVLLYNTIAFNDLGIAIILLTLLIRIVLFPVFQKSARYQVVMQELQPKIKKIQEENKNKLEEQSRAMMALYKEHKVNPLAGMGYLFVQLPILIALYQIFLRIFNPEIFTHLYTFVAAPEQLNTFFLGLINLQNRSILMVCLAAALQYVQAHTSFPKRAPGEPPSDSERMGRRMALVGPALTLAIFWNFPAAISLYWVVSSLFSIIQQLIINRQLHHEKLERVRNRSGGKDGVPGLQG